MKTPGEIRAAFPGFSCWVGAARLRPDQVTVRPIAFDQGWRTPGLQEVGFAVELPRAFVTEWVKQWLIEYRENAESASDDPLRDVLGGRPDAGQTLDDPALAERLAVWGGHDLLLRWLGDGEPEVLPGYVINEVDGWDVGSQVVVVRCRASLVGQPIPSPDGRHSAALAARIERTRERLAAVLASGVRPFGYESKEPGLNPPLDQEEVTRFEETHGVVLPLEHRSFLMQVANGGFGPGYGLNPLERAVFDWVEPVPGDLLRLPFPLTAAYDPEKDDDLEDMYERVDRGELPESHLDRIDRYQAGGTLVLCDEGCGYLHRLVVTGPARGSVWIEGRAGTGGFVPLGVSFLEWYERWLDDVEGGGRGGWWLR